MPPGCLLFPIARLVGRLFRPGGQGMLAAQNVQLVAQLRAKMAEVESLNRRTLAAREEERADLARELHDGVIQDMIGLRYRIEDLEETPDAEQLETQHWIEVAEDCNYVLHAQVLQITNKLSEIGHMLNSMIKKAKRFCGEATDH